MIRADMRGKDEWEEVNLKLGHERSLKFELTPGYERISIFAKQLLRDDLTSDQAKELCEPSAYFAEARLRLFFEWVEKIRLDKRRTRFPNKNSSQAKSESVNRKSLDL